MPNINSGITHGTLKTLAAAFRKGTPVMSSTNFNRMPTAVVNNDLLRYDPLDCVAQVTADHGAITVTREQNAGVMTVLRFLPWGQNCCTGLELDARARVVFSGPFSGCCFFMAKDPHSGRPVMLHSNDNTNQGAMNRPNTLATQRTRADRYLQIFHNGTQPLYHCGYEEMGMVPSWIIAVDQHGDSRTWEVYCVNLLGSVRGTGFSRLGWCLLV